MSKRYTPADSAAKRRAHFAQQRTMGAQHHGRGQHEPAQVSAWAQDLHLFWGCLWMHEYARTPSSNYLTIRRR